VTDDHEMRDRVDSIAADWIIRLDGAPLTSRERAELDAWLAEHPNHRAAFDHARSTWAQLDLLKADPGPLRAHITAVHAVPASIAAKGRHRRWKVMGAGAAGALAVFGFCLFWFGDPMVMLRADHRTGIGEVRTIALDDGSRVDLGPASAIALHFDSHERRVELLSGIASFTAAPKAAAGGRPFVVEAANGEARALGTRFIVDRLPGAVQVTVAEHRVDVTARMADGGAAHAVLPPGRQIRYDAAGLGSVAGVDIGQAEAWRRGRLLFDAAPLRDVVAELNRYRHGRIVIANERLAERRVSGLFDTKDIRGAVAAIASELGASTVDVGPFATIIR